MYWQAVAFVATLCAGLALRSVLRPADAVTLAGKVVWITGASSGIGEALATIAAQRGAKLVLSARRVAPLEALKARLGLPDEDVLVLPLDMMQPEEFEGKVQAVLAHFKRLDVLVNNAGVSQRSAFEDISPAAMRSIMEVNFFGPVLLTQAVLPHMRRQPGTYAGHIVVVSSVQGKIGIPHRSIYAASKHALHGCFDSIRAESHRYGITVLLATPGYVDTDLSRNAVTADGSPTGEKEQRKAISPSQCAEAIVTALQRGQDEVYAGGLKEWTGLTLQRFAPGLLRRAVRLPAP
eukprot:EG_transcript_17241